MKSPVPTGLVWSDETSIDRGRIRMKITEREVESFRRGGYACVERAFDAEEVARAVGWVDELQDWPETPGRHMMYF